MSALKHFNPEALCEVVQLDEHGEGGLLESLTENYGSNFDYSMKAMKVAIDMLDYKTLEREAHSLKSSSNLLGLMVLGALCAEIEHAARAQKMDPAKQALLEQEFEEAFPELVSFTKNLKKAA